MKKASFKLVVSVIILIASFGLFYNAHLLKDEINGLSEDLSSIIDINKYLNEVTKEISNEKDKFIEEIEVLNESINELDNKLTEIAEAIREVRDENTRLEVEAREKSQSRNNSGAETVTALSPARPHVRQGETNPDEKVAFLTFDDGPSHVTVAVLDVLRKYNVPATFFVNGRTDSHSISTYKRIVNEGHAIGNHTYTHQWSEIYSSVDNFMKDFLRLEELLYKHTGVRPQILRFPSSSNYTFAYRYGGKDIMDDIIAELTTRGYEYFDWNVNSGDTNALYVPKEKIVSNVLTRVEGINNVNILFHDLGTKITTAEALSEIIEGLIDMGYRFEPITTKSFAPRFR